MIQFVRVFGDDIYSEGKDVPHTSPIPSHPKHGMGWDIRDYALRSTRIKSVSSKDSRKKKRKNV